MKWIILKKTYMYPKNKANTEAIHIGHFIQHKSLYICVEWTLFQADKTLYYSMYSFAT